MDSDNILSILASLSGGGNPAAGTPANYLQTAQAPPPQLLAPPQTFTPPPEAVPTKRRRSLLDIIGSASDVIAKVGGAQALYQPSLDAREDRTLALGDHTRQMAAQDLKSATDKFALGDSQNSRVGQVARGVKAIMAGNPNADPATLWPALAQQMQLDPATTQSISQAIATQGPGVLDGLITGNTDPKYDQSKYGGQPVLATGPDGKIHAFQASLNGEDARDILPPGYTAIDPAKAIDTGGAQVLIGSRSNNPIRILPKTAKPDTVLTANTSRDNNIRTNATSRENNIRTNAAKPGAGGKGDPSAGLQIVKNIQDGFDNLHRLNALPGEGGTVGNLIGTLGRTSMGQAIGATTGLSAAAQEREVLAKNLKTLQSDLLKSLPGNATRTRFEQEIQNKRLPDPTRMTYESANRVIAEYRDAYTRALQTSEGTSAPGKILPKANAGGWSVVGVK